MRGNPADKLGRVNHGAVYDARRGCPVLGGKGAVGRAKVPLESCTTGAKVSKAERAISNQDSGGEKK